MIPFSRPAPARLSEHLDELREIEDRATFTNFGPVNARFENALGADLFGGTGGCLTVCNATIGLMIAIREATAVRAPSQQFALMPSFTFAAAAQAAMWCGLKPLFCDIDGESWAADPAAEERLLRKYRGRIAVVVPYATFGFPIDLGRYERLAEEHGIPVVVDAAASLGTRDAAGRGFGTGFRGSIVFSMHATKSFATGEGGVIYSGDPGRIAALRTMSNFGFGELRQSTMPGLNAKLSEVAALLAELRLREYPDIVRHRSRLASLYRASLPNLVFQPVMPGEQAHQFAAALVPADAGPLRSALQARMAARGVQIAHYFSPHVAEHAYFRRHATSGPLPVTEDVASRIVSLPLHDAMTAEHVATVASVLLDELRQLRIETHEVASETRTVPEPLLQVPVPIAAERAAVVSLHP